MSASAVAGSGSGSGSGARPPLPFGLGRDAACSPARCLQPGTPLPLPGSPLHDQVAASLASLLSTFFSTSLRYLGVSEILDWVESNKTIDAWILTGLEQGRAPSEVANDKNLDVGRGAITSVIKAALEQDDDAWATSLREVGFSSGMSMAYEGIVSQLKLNKSSPLPCLHTLLTPTGLSMLKSAPLKHAFPICPPRSAPSPSSLLASIRSLLAAGALSGPEWATAADWRPQIRRAFARYHAMVKQAAEALVSDPAFATEYTIFLESISQPLQLLALISDDFEHEFGAGACKGLLGVGDVGGQNLIQIMDFCAARRPSELLKRVKVRVKEKREREDRENELRRLRARVEALRAEADKLRRSLGDGDDDEVRAARIDIVSRESDLLDADIRAREQREQVRDDELRRSVERAKALVANESRLPPPPPPGPTNAATFIQGSSKDLLRLMPADNPFASTAPRAVSPSPASAKGKGRALHPVSGASRAPSRYPSRLPPLAPPAPAPLETPPSSPTPTCDESCCATCASEMLQNTMGPILAKRSFDAAPPVPSSSPPAAAEDTHPAPPSKKPTPSSPVPEPTAVRSKKKKSKSKKPKPSAPEPPLALVNARSPPPFLPLSRCKPPQCCPPDRCTGDAPNHFIWPELDGLLYETCLAGYKYELIDNLVLPLSFIRDELAKRYLRMGGLMTADDGEPKSMHAFVRLAEKGMWTAVAPEVQAFTQRTLAVSLQKLMEVFRAQLGEVCICRLSQHPEVLESARQRLSECELADRKIPIELPAMDQQQFMKWCHSQLRSNVIAGPEWEGLDRSYRVADFLLAFADAFDCAIDRMVEHDPYLVAEDMCTMLEWHGGVRAFDAAVRLGSTPIAEDALEGDENEDVPLAGWGHLLALSGEARVAGTPFSKDLAEAEKKKGNSYFVAGEYQKSIVSFAAASIIHPTDQTYWTNAAAARIKIGSPLQYSEAISDCTFALFYDRTNVKALYRRGTSLAMLGRWNEAIVDLTELVRLAPENQPAKDALAWAQKRTV